MISYKGVPMYIDVKQSSFRLRRSLSRLLYHEMKENNATTVTGVYGRTGAGKSIYAMKVAFDFYGDWESVLKSIIFTPFDFQEVMDYLEEIGGWVPVIIWDDAGPWLEMLKRNSWHPIAIGVRGLFETMRLRVGAVILTMTCERSMPRSLLYNGNLYKYRARVLRNGHKPNGTPQSIVEIQQRREKRSEWGSFYWDSSILYKDYITLKLPVYEEYNMLRRSFIKLYNKMVMASREIGPAQLLDFVYREWKKMKLDVAKRIDDIIENSMHKQDGHYSINNNESIGPPESSVGYGEA